ncbi:MAG TPA: response regulator [Polyangiaceae bacterium]|jgi:CheY-like chemotaxis protein|nr:response regulator [Polyangiaceae bacterium]
MSSVALASRLHSAESEDSCSDLNQVVARLEQSIARIAGNHVGVQFSLSPNVARVAISTTELEEVVLGLCVEASGLLGPGGRLVVETRGMNDAHLTPSQPPADARARIIVRAEQAGEPAQRVTTYPEIGATDLESLLKRLGGQLELVPLAVNDLAYVAHLPYALVSNSSGRMAIALPHEACVILLVEDEPQVQAVTARILRAFGYSVITAHNERSALAQAEQHGGSIGLVVSDLVLPGVSGKDLVRRLRKPCEHAQILYISGYSPEHVGALTDGACFLRKPFTAQELLAVVRDLMPVVAD